MTLLNVCADLIPVAAIALLIRIAVRDLAIQKITNNDLWALALLGLGNNILLLQGAQFPSSVWLAPAAGLAILIALFPFWMVGKIGAGDVKFLSIVPLFVGVDYLLAFGVLLLAFIATNLYIIKGTVLDGVKELQRYVDFFGGKGIIPFGVPISAAATAVILMQLISLPSPIG